MAFAPMVLGGPEYVRPSELAQSGDPPRWKSRKGLRRGRLPGVLFISRLGKSERRERIRDALEYGPRA